MNREARIGIAVLIALAVGAVGICFRCNSNPDVAPASGQLRDPDNKSMTIRSVVSHVELESTSVGGGFSGRVLNWQTGAGVSRAQVSFADDRGAPAFTVETDDNGEFAVEAQAPGNYVLAVATAEGFSSFGPEWGSNPITVVARPGMRIRDIVLYLRPATKYVGVVENERGARVAGATVELLGAHRGQGAGKFITDANGEFTFGAPDGTLLEAQHPNFGVGRAQLDRPAVAIQRVVIRLAIAGKVTTLGAITGRVIDVTGRPVANTLVRAASTAMDIRARSEAMGDQNGRFRLEGLELGEHAVWADCNGCASSKIVAATGADITLVIGTGGTIRGHVREFSSGTPVATFTLQLFQKRGATMLTIDEIAVLDAEGRFEMRGLPLGEFAIRAIARGYGPSLPRTVSVTDTSSSEVLLQLTAGGSIRGTISDTKTGARLPGALVVLDGTLDFSAIMPRPINAVADRNGEFQLDAVAPGVRSIRGQMPGYNMAIIGGLNVEEGKITDGIALALSSMPEGVTTPSVEVVGIGAKLKVIADTLVIQEIIPDGGSEAAGLVVGNSILAVEGESVSSLGSQAALDRLRGPEGTRVKVTVRRPGVETISIERRGFKY